MADESFMQHEVDSEEDEESAGLESSERENLSSREIRELQQQQEKKEASLPQRKVTPTSARKDKALQMEERPEEPRKRNPFLVIADSLNEIRECCGQTQKVVWAACALVEVEGEDTLIEMLEGLS